MNSSSERAKSVERYENAVDEIDSIFAEILEEVKQSELVKIFGVTKSHISRIKSGERELTTEKKAVFIKKLLKLQQNN